MSFLIPAFLAGETGGGNIPDENGQVAPVLNIRDSGYPLSSLRHVTMAYSANTEVAQLIEGVPDLLRPIYGKADVGDDTVTWTDPGADAKLFPTSKLEANELPGTFVISIGGKVWRTVELNDNGTIDFSP